jgi:hypothetical protein
MSRLRTFRKAVLDVEGDQGGVQSQEDLEGKQGQEDQQDPQGAQQQTQVLADPAASKSGEDYQALLAKRDERIAELEGQVAEAAKTKETADELTAKIEKMKADALDAQAEFELRLAGARNLTAGKVLLADHDGDVAKLKAAEPWLFEDATPQGGTTGLEPAGAAGTDDKAEMRRWREIAGITDDKE